MSTITKVALAALAAVLLGGGALAIAQTSGSGDDGSVTDPTTTVGDDVKGPCDEAEHANDPRCQGQQVPEDKGGGERGDDDGADDISGPCDEAEHANDPRCTGAGGQAGDDEDNSGPGSANSGHGHGDDDAGHEDNSGPGSANSGHGQGGDDDGAGEVEDHSGSGHGGSGSGDDSSGGGESGSGHGGSDDD